VSDNPLRTLLLTTPLALRDGRLMLPEGPGLGVAVDEGVVERYRVC
jgi:D-galactarolactone cycloisomerase